MTGSWFFVFLCEAIHQNGLAMNQALLGLSPSILPGPKEGDLATHDIGHEAKRMHSEKGQHSALLKWSCLLVIRLWVTLYTYLCWFKCTSGLKPCPSLSSCFINWDLSTEFSVTLFLYFVLLGIKRNMARSYWIVMIDWRTQRHYHTVFYFKNSPPEMT